MGQHAEDPEGAEVMGAGEPSFTGPRICGHGGVSPAPSCHICHAARVLRSGIQSPVLRRTYPLHTGWFR